MSDGDHKGVTETLVLNALRELTIDGSPVVEDSTSKRLIRESYEAVTDSEDRTTFVETLRRIEREPDDVDSKIVIDRVRDVVRELSSRGVRAVLVHDAPLSFQPREAYLYSFMTTHDPSFLDGLELPASVETEIRDGAEYLTASDVETATTRFERAVDESGGDIGAVSSRVLWAYTSHLNGADSLALDLVEEALHLDMRTWSAKVVGLAASHRFPEQFRSGKLGARVYLRWTTEASEGGDVSAAFGASDGEPTPLAGTGACMPIERLFPDSQLRIRVSGRLPEIPAILGYYVALGVVDQEVNEARSVERLFLKGPDVDGVTETVRFTDEWQ